MLLFITFGKTYCLPVSLCQKATLVNVHIEGSSWMSILNPLAYSISYQQSKVEPYSFHFALLTTVLHDHHCRYNLWADFIRNVLPVFPQRCRGFQVQRPPFAVPTTRMHTNELNLSANTFQSCVADPHPQSSLTIWCGKRFYDISVTPLAQVCPAPHSAT